MSEVDNLGGESIGSTETVKHGTWRYKRMPPSPLIPSSPRKF